MKVRCCRGAGLEAGPGAQELGTCLGLPAGLPRSWAVEPHLAEAGAVEIHSPAEPRSRRPVEAKRERAPPCLREKSGVLGVHFSNYTLEL